MVLELSMRSLKRLWRRDFKRDTEWKIC